MRDFTGGMSECPVVMEANIIGWIEHIYVSRIINKMKNYGTPQWIYGFIFSEMMIWC